MEVEVRRARHARYLRLAAVHAGAIGPWELAPLYERAYAFCSGAEGPPCAGVGGSPGSAWRGGLSTWREAPSGGGRKGRELVEGLWVCVAHLEGVFPPEFLPVLKATRQALEHLQGQGA